MNNKNASAYLPLLQALIDGKTIQYWTTAGEWEDAPELSFSLDSELYRIKPDPQLPVSNAELGYWKNAAKRYENELIATTAKLLNYEQAFSNRPDSQVRPEVIEIRRKMIDAATRMFGLTSGLIDGTIPFKDDLARLLRVHKRIPAGVNAQHVATFLIGCLDLEIALSNAIQSDK